MIAQKIPLEQLRGIVNTHRGLGEMTLEQCEADGVALWQWVIGQEPGRGGRVQAAIEDAIQASHRREAPQLTNGGGG